MEVLSERMVERLREAGPEFARGEPFPSIVIDDFLHPDAAQILEESFASARGDWITYHHVNERKRGFNQLSGLPEAARAVIGELQAAPFVAALASLSGIDGLISDPDLDGGDCTKRRRAASSTCIPTFSRTPAAPAGAGRSISSSS